VVVQLAAAAVYTAVVVRAAVAEGATLRPDRRAIRSAGSDGWLLFVRTLFLRGAFFVLMAAAARLGEIELAAQQIAMQIWALLALALDSLEVAAQTLVGQALGGGSATTAQLAGRRTLRWGTGFGFAAAVVVLALHDVIPHLFSDDPAVTSLASFLLVWVAISQPLGGPAFVLDGILVGSGDLLFLARAMAAICLVMIIGEPIVLWLGGGMGWLWAVFIAFMVVRVVVLGGRAASNRWAVTGATRR
jgi:putative MATE family efflux protein